MRESETEIPNTWSSAAYNTVVSGEKQIEDYQKNGALVVTVGKGKRKQRRRRSKDYFATINSKVKQMNSCSSDSGGTNVDTINCGGNSSIVCSVSVGNNVTTVTNIHNSTSSSNGILAAPLKLDVKQERLSPCSAIGDNNSSSSRSDTPASSIGQADPLIPSPCLSPAGQVPPSLKSTEQPVLRNCSDIMRSLAAKYNNSNPNEYYSSSRNGLCGVLGDNRFSSFKSSGTLNPFASLFSPLINPNAETSSSSLLGNQSPATGAKDIPTEVDSKSNIGATGGSLTENPLFANFGFNTFASTALSGNGGLPLFTPLVDMSSTQALLNMVRAAGVNSVNSLESCPRSSSSNHAKRPISEVSITSGSNPLDLSSPSSASLLSSSKKRKYAATESSNVGSTYNTSNSTSSSNTGSNNSGSPYNLDITGDSRVLNALQRSIKDRLHPKAPGTVSPKSRSSGSNLPKLNSGRLSPSLSINQQSSSTKSLSSYLPVCSSNCSEKTSDVFESISSWTVDDVCNFVTSIDICSEYAGVFREHCIDGTTLPLLTEDHLRSTMNMKLGPALKLRVVLGQKLGHCFTCNHCVQCHITNAPLAAASLCSTQMSRSPPPHQAAKS